jgi:hypothetical protein
MMEVIITQNFASFVEHQDLFTKPVSGLCPAHFLVNHFDDILTLVYEYCTYFYKLLGLYPSSCSLQLIKIIKIRSKLLLFSLKTGPFLSPKPVVIFTIYFLLLY